MRMVGGHCGRHWWAGIVLEGFHGAAAPPVLGEVPFSKILTFLYTLGVTEKHLKTEAKQTTKIKIQMENANEDHPSFISSFIWQLAESTVLRMALVLIGEVC